MKRITALLLILAAVFLVSCGVRPEDGRVVLTLDGERIYYDYYRYVYLNTRDDLTGGDADYFEIHPEAEETVRAGALETLLRYRAIQILAKKYGVALSSEDKKEIEASIRSQRETLGEEAFRAGLEEAYLTEYALRYTQYATVLWSELYDTVTNEMSGIILCGDETLAADIPVHFRRIRYLYLAGGEGREALAGTLRDRAAAGEDFAALIKEYGENDLMESRLEDGYYYTTGQIEPKVEAAVEALPEGGLSEVLTLWDGFVIVQRLALEEEYVNRNWETLRIMYRARVFQEMIEETQKKIRIKETELYRTLTPDTVT